MAHFEETQQYESPSESEDEMEIDRQNIQEKAVVRRRINWVKDKSSSDDVEAQIAVTQEEQWSRCCFLSQEVKQNIKELFDLKLKLKKIYEVLPITI